jgi:hypothetical protein
MSLSQALIRKPIGGLDATGEVLETRSGQFLYAPFRFTRPPVVFYNVGYVRQHGGLRSLEPRANTQPDVRAQAAEYPDSAAARDEAKAYLDLNSPSLSLCRESRDGRM